MLNNERIKLTDLIDVELLQKSQDVFASMIDVASLIVDEDGPVTNPSSFNDFCLKMREKEEGNRRCTECDVMWGKIAAKKKEPIIYTCHAGLKDFVVPIIVEDQYIAGIYGGQVLTEEPDEGECDRLSKEVGIDKEECIKNLKKLKVIKQDDFEKAQQFLTFIASVISNIATKRLELIKMNKSETLISNIIEKIRSSLEIKEIMSYICEEVAKLFDVQRVVLVAFTNEKGEQVDYSLRQECKISPDIKSTVDSPLFPDLAHYWTSNQRENILTVFDNIENSEAPEFFKEIYREIGVKSAIGVQIRKDNKVWGALNLFQYEVERTWTEAEKNVLLSITSQVYVAIKQAELFENERKRLERESLLRKIIETVRSSLDLEEVKKKVTEEVCKAFKADRCYFRYYIKSIDKIIPPDTEYLASDDIPSLKESEPDQNSLKYFIEQARKYEKRFYPITVDESFAKGTELEGYLNTFNIKADYAVPIINRQDELSWLVLHYLKENVVLSEDDLKLLETIAYQIDIAFEQINLYNKAQKAAERENSLRKIYETMRSSLDTNVIKKEIVTQVGRLFNTDICMLFNYSKEEDKFFADENSEYKPDANDKSRVDFNINDEKNKWFLDTFKKCLDSCFYKAEDFLKENNLENHQLAQLFAEYNIKSACHLPIYYANNLLGVLVLNYTKDYRKISDEEMEFLQTVTTQAGIALHQAQLYKQSKMQTEREKIIKNFIEIIRSSLDKSTIKTLFVKNIGKYFNADRVCFSEYDVKTKRYLPVEVNAEYLSSPSVLSFANYDMEEEAAREYLQPLYEKKELNIYSWNEYISQNQKSEAYIKLFEKFEVKSSYNLPVLYQERLMGYFCIEFTSKVRKLSDDDVNLIRSICRQAGIALYQAELYERAQFSLKLKQDFITNFFKEIKAPLSNISGISDALVEAERNCSITCDKQYEYLNGINQNVDQLLGMIKHIDD